MFSTALVTGANSGLGFEAAAQLADEGAGEVIVTARNATKADEAVRQLVERTGKNVFTPMVLDLGASSTIEAAVGNRAGKAPIDFLVLNAGIAPDTSLKRTADGVEMTMAASLTGHHLLTMGLLNEGLLSGQARIVIAGSEAARGDVPTFKPADMSALAAADFGGDVSSAVRAYMRMEEPLKYHPSNTYATTKLFVAWWAAELSARLPEGMTVNAVSPGSTPDTNAARNAPAYMTYIMLPVLKLIPGMSHTIADGAARYLEVGGYDESGNFYASKPKKMTGPLHKITLPVFDNPPAQSAVWDVLGELTGASYPSASRS